MALKLEYSEMQERVVELLNSAAVANDDQGKVENLIKIQESIIHQDPALLDNFLDEMTAFQHDRSADVRKFVVGFIEEACKTNQELLPKVMNNLQFLLADSSVAVQKRVVQALTQVYKLTLQWLSSSNAIVEEMEKAWITLNQMKTQVSQMIDHDNDGVRTIAVKFYEMLIVCQTYPESDSIRRENEFSLEDMPFTIKFARLTKLEEEANIMLESLIKFHGSAHISSANLMACMGSLTHIAKSRPQFLDRIVVAMELLHSNLPPTLSKSQVNSVRKHLKLQLLTILKHPASFTQSETIKNLLTELGATPQEITKNLPNPEEVAKNPRRLEDFKNAPVAKRRKIETSSDQTGSSENPKSIRQNALRITEDFIVQKLTARKAAEIAVDALPRIESSMPVNFSSLYSPVADAGTPSQVRHVARLLAMQMTNVGIGPGAQQLGYAPQKRIELDGDEEAEVVGEKTIASNPLKQELNKNEPPKPDAPPVQPVALPVRPKQRPMKLAEMTKPLSPQANLKLAKAALGRLLKAERTAMLGGMAATRQKILASLVTLFPDDFRNQLVDYIMADPRARIEIAFSWIYEEYSMIMGFSCQGSSITEEQKQMSIESYSIAFCLIANNLRNQLELKEREQLLTRLYLESPVIPEEGVSILRLMLCDEPKLVEVTIQIVQQLVHRPTKQLVYLNFLLEVSNHEVDDVRMAALSCLIELYDKGPLRRVIEEYALMHLKFLLLDQPPAILCGPEKGRNEPVSTWTEEVVKACLYLFLTILRHSEKLIHELATVYVQTNADIKRKILKMVEEPVEGMGMNSPELLKLIETCPKGAETLLTRIIHIMTDKYPPTPALVENVRNLYQNRVPNVRLLIPVLNGLTKKEVLTVLPKIIKLNPEILKLVFQKLFVPQAGGQAYPSPLSPTELLIALHNIDSSKCELISIVKATSLCFSEKSVFTQEVLAVVIQQLLEQNPLPTLLMRTVLQALSLYSKLLPFVMNIMQRLIVKQVWKQKKVWEGFIKCCQRTSPQSFTVILQLPPQFLQELLNTAPDLKVPLLKHVTSFTENQRLHIPKLTMDVLNGIAQFQGEAETNNDDNEKQVGSPEPTEPGLQMDSEPPVPGDF